MSRTKDVVLAELEAHQADGKRGAEVYQTRLRELGSKPEHTEAEAAEFEATNADLARFSDRHAEVTARLNVELAAFGESAPAPAADASAPSAETVAINPRRAR